MKRLWKTGAVIAALLMSGAALAGCGSAEGTGTSAEAISGEASSEAGSAETGSQYDDEAVIVWGLTSQWADLTPFDNSAGGYYSGIKNSLIYDKLVYAKMDGSIEERAAQSWTVSDDKKVFTFHLNPGSKFHDGQPATAADWVFAARLLANPEAGFADHSAAMTIIAGTNDAGDLVNEEEFGFKALDDTTLEITLKNPMGESTFLTTYSVYYTCLPEHLLGDVDPVGIASNEFFTAPVGSGPCVFENLVSGSELTLARFKDYPIGEAHYSKMVFRIMSATAQATALMSGEIDIPYTALTTDEAKELEGVDNVAVTLPEQAFNMWFMAVNNQRIQDKRVRQAINYVIDKDLICSQLLQGLGQPIETYFNPDNPYIPDTIQYECNAEKAKELLDAAKADGYDGKFVIATPAGIRERIAALVEQNMENIGFDVEVQVLEAATLFADLRSGADGTYDGGMIGMGVSPDPCYFDSQLNLRASNFASVTDPTYEDYQNKFVAAATEEEGKQIMGEYLEYIHEECPYIFIASYTNYQTFSKRMGDIAADYSATNLRDMGVWNWKVTK